MATPAKCITVVAARALQDNWVATRQPEIDRTLNYQDAREVIYSVEELQEYLNYVKEESVKQGIANPGIRLYFAAYNTDANNKATIFLAPTDGIAVGSNNIYTIQPFNHGMAGIPPFNY